MISWFQMDVYIHIYTYLTVRRAGATIMITSNGRLYSYLTVRCAGATIMITSNIRLYTYLTERCAGATIMITSNRRLYTYLTVRCAGATIIFCQCLIFEKYLTMSSFTRRIISKFRITNHRLPIEVGRYAHLPMHTRLCDKCELGYVGDEFHFLFECPELHDLHTELLPRFNSQ